LRKIVSSLIVALLFLSLFVFTLRVQKVEAAIPDFIYIKSNGLVEPSNASITNDNNMTYTLTGDLIANFYVLWVQRDNIIIDGAGHALQSLNHFDGIEMNGRDNVTIKNFKITGCYHGIFLDASTWATIDNCTFTGNNDAISNGYTGAWNCTITNNNVTAQTNGINLGSMSDAMISGNTVKQCSYGLILHGGVNVTVQGNLISGNTWGIWPLDGGSNISIVDNTISNNYRGVSLQGENDTTRVIYHNRFIGNTIHAESLVPAGATCKWDDGYPSGGNYWSGFVSPDLFSGPYQNVTGGDGIGDYPCVIDVNNRDNYPFMLLSICNVSQTPPKDNVLPTDTVKVNATVTHLFPLEQVILNCTFSNSSATWTTSINMTNLEDNVWNGTILPFPIGTNVTYTIIAQDNAGNSISSQAQGYSFKYPVVPEFSSLLLLPLFVLATFFAMIYKKRRIIKK